MNIGRRLPEARTPETTKPRYAFGPFVLDTDRRLLVRGGQPLALTPKTYDALVVLVESGGRFLSKTELIQLLWPDSFVEESNLTQQISAVRKALGESPGEDRYIVTLPGRGYRFAAQVTEAASHIEPANHPVDITGGRAQPDERERELPVVAESAALPVRETQLRSQWSRPAQVASLLLLVIALAAIAYMAQRRLPVGTGSSARMKSLAILPFRNLQKDEDSDFLSFSLADAVIAKLSYISELTVRPSSAVERYRDQPVDVKKVARELEVDTLLTGNFIREGDVLRITSELIDIKTQRILWKTIFDVKYERLLTVEESVARQIVDGLALHLSPSEVRRLKADRPMDPLAYEFYLRGADLYLRSEFPLAIKMLEKSVELNPNYALTWAYLGKCYEAIASFQFGGREQHRKAQTAYERALSLEPGQIEARVYMANMFTDTGRVERAVPLLRQALKANPNYPEALWELGYAYRFAGALNESVVQCERARQLDAGVKLNSSTFNSYLYRGEYEKFLQTLPKGDDVPLIIFYRGFGEYYIKRWEQAAIDFDRAFELDHSLLQAQVGKALSFCIRHQCEKGLNLLRAAEEKITERGVSDPEAIYKIAQAYSMLGDRLSGLRVLKKSILSGFFSYPYLAKDPLLNNLRGQHDFNVLIAEARLRHESFKKKFL